MSELKPCPFCGMPVSEVYNSFENAFKFYHKYGDDEMNCCVIEPIMIEAVSLADAADKWNGRADNER